MLQEDRLHHIVDPAFDASASIASTAPPILPRNAPLSRAECLFLSLSKHASRPRFVKRISQLRIGASALLSRRLWFTLGHNFLIRLHARAPSCPARHGTVEIGLTMGARPFLGVGVADVFAIARAQDSARARRSSAKAPAWVREQE
jgi:hypothetical protein